MHSFSHSRDLSTEYSVSLSLDVENVNGENKVMEQGWFQKGTLIVVNGYRNGDMFRAKKYKKTNSHQLYKITKVNKDGTIEMTNNRYGENIDN